MNKEIIPIVFATDNGYVPILHVAVKSLVAQASSDYKYNIHVLYEKLTDENKKSFDVYKSENVDIIMNDLTKVIADCSKAMHSKYYYSNAIYYRVFIPELFPEYKKALYLDCDIALNADISELYNFDIGHNYLGAVTCETVNTNPVFTEYAEKFLGIKMPAYFNSGVLLLNCEKLREVKFQDKFFELVKKYKLELCPDQDYYNLLCLGKTKHLPAVWNKIPRPSSKEKLDEVKLVHYNLSLKPWRYDDILYQEPFWEYAKKTEQYDKIVAMKNEMSESDFARDKERMASLLMLAKQLSDAKETLVAEIYENKSPERVAVLERISENEKKGNFNVDVENDPPFEKLNVKKFDFKGKRLTTKIKTHFAYKIGRSFYEKMIKDRSVVWGGVTGLGNIKGFSGGAVVTCNHIHQFDNYAVQLGFEQAFDRLKLYKIVREGNWAFKGKVGFILRNARTIPISLTNLRMTAECIKAAKYFLNRGEKVLVYPEQSMWWNYRKPRPLKDGAFAIASKANVPVIPCFITLKDTDIVGADGFPVQEFTLNILPVIPCDEPAVMKEQNAKLWNEVYDRIYGKK